MLHGRSVTDLPKTSGRVPLAALSSAVLINCLPEKEASFSSQPNHPAKRKLDMIMNANLDNFDHGIGGAVDGSGRQPDADHIKMFVGQLPRSFADEDVRKLFQEFGSIYQINMLRDKATGQSKGCCFITFHQRKSALDAQNALHNIRILPGMHNPVQMKPADSENRSERKLFVGMISKKASEDDIRKMFLSFGNIEECTILRDNNGNSRGCAFVTFASRQNALNAIRALHHSMTAEGCSSPVVVKMADSTKDKDSRRQNIGSLTSLIGNPALSPLGQHYLNLMQPASGLTLGGLLGAGNPGLAGMNVGFHQFSQLSPSANGLLANLSGNPMGMSSGNEYGLNPTSSALSSLAAQLNSANALYGATGGSVNGTHGNTSAAAAALQNYLSSLNALNAAQQQADGNGGAALSVNGSSLATSLASKGLHGAPYVRGPRYSDYAGSASTVQGSPITSLAGYGNGLSSLASLTGYGAYDQLSAYSQLGSLAKALNQNAMAVQKPAEGPEGCNLFIYHLPPEFGDQDLAQLFSSFGNVVSAKVFVDKNTALSKCFGFVSFDNPVSAQAAITSMNGFQIGLKRLKVQLKRSKEGAKPY